MFITLQDHQKKTQITTCNLQCLWISSLKEINVCLSIFKFKFSKESCCNSAWILSLLRRCRTIGGVCDGWARQNTSYTTQLSTFIHHCPCYLHAKERIAHVIFHATPNGHVNNEKILKRGRCLRCDAGGIGGGVDDELLLFAVKGSVSKGELRLLLVDCVLDATSCSSFSRSASWELLAS